MKISGRGVAIGLTSVLSAGSAVAEDKVPAAYTSLPPPNILWITWEDVGPHFGCYGDGYADSPNIDRLAGEGITYTNCFTHSPVSAPSRTGIMTGMYPAAYGGHHMQCRAIPGEEVRLFPRLLREAGYYCSNDGKHHYQMEHDGDIIWDVSAPGARWGGRSNNQPFFSVINYGSTHEGRTRTDDPRWRETLQKELGENRHDPALAPVPPYLPDTRVVRECIAQYYDNITLTDRWVGELIGRLKNEGLYDNTVIFFWGDHGWGIPRGKRWPYDAGLHVPLIVRIPEKYIPWADPDTTGRYRAGAVNRDMVAFVDLAPTVLSLAGTEIPSRMHGKAFLGPRKEKARQFIYGGRDRMDETYDCMRIVRNEDFLYVRNYMPHLPYAQTVRTMDRHPVMQEWRKLHADGELNDVQSRFFAERKPPEELYDVKNDLHQVNNLVGEKEYQKVLEEMRRKHEEWTIETGDAGLIPEPELDRMKWPDDQWNMTGKPEFTIRERMYWTGAVEVSMKCMTPGASIAWRYDYMDHWMLYKDPVLLRPGQELQAKASRLGFLTSQTASISLNNRNHVVATEPSNHRIIWYDRVRESGMIHRLMDVKALDLYGEDALDQYYDHLNDPLASIRYWAVSGIRAYSENKKEIERARRKFRELAKDPSPVVAIEAAHGLCQWGDTATGVPVLRQALDHPQESVRLYAANTLDKIGEMARLALPFPEMPAGTAGYYSHRIFLRIYKRLGIDPTEFDYVTPRQADEIRGQMNTIYLENLWKY